MEGVDEENAKYDELDDEGYEEEKLLKTEELVEKKDE